MEEHRKAKFLITRLVLLSQASAEGGPTYYRFLVIFVGDFFLKPILRFSGSCNWKTSIDKAGKWKDSGSSIQA